MLILRSFVHTGNLNQAVNKAQLSKLRKKTGFTFTNCKKALQKFDNDIEQAEIWLKEEAQKEGWTKASKLQNRQMSNGLVGLVVENDNAAIVEVNCETDFVARNEKFQKMVSTIASTFLQHGQRNGSKKLTLDKDALGQIRTDKDKPLSDLVAMEIGNIGENMLVRRAAYMQATGAQRLGSYVHSAGANIPKDGFCRLGKYGALVTISQENSPNTDQQLSLVDLGSQIAQHIVGMNPSTIGEPPGTTEKDTPTGTPEGTPADTTEGSPKDSKDDETRLVFQEFLLDSAVSVGEMLNMNACRVDDFVRFECGEEMTEDSQ